MVQARGKKTRVRRLQVDGVRNFEDLRHTRNQHEQKAERWLVDYLKNATVFVYSPGVERDVFDATKVAGTGSVQTDGVWAWPDALGYYVAQYNLALPAVFLEHARSHPLQELQQADLRLLELVPEEW